MVAASQEGTADLPPNERLVRMSNAYLHFAADNANLWRALFDIEMSTDSRVPAWYLEELGRLFSFIAAPLADIFPEKNEVEAGPDDAGVVFVGARDRSAWVGKTHLGGANSTGGRNDPADTFPNRKQIVSEQRSYFYLNIVH